VVAVVATTGACGWVGVCPTVAVSVASLAAGGDEAVLVPSVVEVSVLDVPSDAAPLLVVPVEVSPLDEVSVDVGSLVAVEPVSEVGESDVVEPPSDGAGLEEEGSDDVGSVDERSVVSEVVAVVPAPSAFEVDDEAAVAALPSPPSASAAGASTTHASNATTNVAAPAARAPNTRPTPSLALKQFPPRSPCSIPR
jgi:hypothetical protein